MQNRKKPVKDFSDVARVVFDTATKAGIFRGSQEHQLMYKRSLENLQKEVKTRGGSLGKINFALAEVVSMHSTKKQPLLSSPALQLHAPIISKQAAVPLPRVTPPNLNILLQPKKDDHHISSLQPPNVEMPKITFPVKLSSISQAEQTPPRVEIGEKTQKLENQQPGLLFGYTKIVAQTQIEEENAPPSDSELKLRLFTPSAAATVLAPPEKIPDKPKAQKISAPDGSQGAEQVQNPVAFSMQDWEAQREHELFELKNLEIEQEKRRQDRELEIRDAALTEKWLAQRTTRGANSQYIQGEQYEACKEMFFAPTWRDAVAAFKSQTCDANVPPIPYSTGVLISRLQNAPFAETAPILEQLKTLCRKYSKSHGDLVKTVTLCTSSAADFDAEISKLSAVQLAQLSAPLLFRAIGSTMRRVGWKDAFSLLRQVQEQRHDPSANLELKVLRSIQLRAVVPTEERHSAVLAILDQIKAKRKGTLGILHKVAAIPLLKEPQRGELLQTLDPMSDERILGHVIRYSRGVDVESLLERARSSGLNVDSPPVLVSRMGLAMRQQDHGKAEDIFRTSREKSISMFLSYLWVISLKKKGETIVEAIAEFQRAFPRDAPRLCLRVLGTVMGELQMNQEIVSLYDACGGFPPAASTAVINTALQAVGRAETMESKTQTESTSFPSIELMLEYAKQRNWAEALRLLAPFESIQATQATEQQLLLSFNCALSSAVDHIDILETILGKMKNIGLQPNSTTFNTILSAYSRSELHWPKTREIFQKMPDTLKDSSSYSVILSLLGRQNMWEEAMSTFASVKKAVSKPSPMMFNLAIQAVYRHDAVATLQLYQDLVKTHGVSHVKDTTVSRVIRALEQAGKNKEAKQIEGEFARKKKPKGDSP